MTTPHTPLFDQLGGRLSDAVSWVASAISMAAALGLVNLTVGLLSAAWLATQLFRFWRYEVHQLRRADRLPRETPPPAPHQPEDPTP